MLIFLLSLFGILGVALGAIGQHMLQDSLTPNLMHTFSTAVDYHQLYSILLLVLFYIHTLRAQLVPRSVITCFFLGTLLFSGSLYAYIFTQWHFLVFITPIGGFTLMGAWLWTGFTLYYYKKNKV